ncbi:hypothetical protein BJ973_001273 [Actinoplanes tereljensis]|uniref:DUF4157 domain-containing protein n=1 Tax=Paractinoplanes tereljensis TaxID=571912 RepID=A0A919NL75_9ACTN|nr:DUF4157 domain-containing protein [Actinoplanes tereljensis]GIF20821.1 hypothetical protein Ate02nite_35510 [Actinoplanes tereljensis]
MRERERRQRDPAAVAAEPELATKSAPPLVSNRAVAQLLSTEDGTRLDTAEVGVPLRGVRVHTGPEAAASAATLGARAYTSGEHVVLGSGSDHAVLLHELTHVAQNRHGVGAEAGGEAAEREARQTAALVSLGLPAPPIRAAGAGLALTPVSDKVEDLVSYGLADWAVTAGDESDVLSALETDPDFPATVFQMFQDHMLEELFDRIDVPANRRRLVQLMGAKLNAMLHALVEPHIRKLGPEFELQFNLGKFGVTSAAPAFDPKPLETALVDRSKRTSGGSPTTPFSGVGATGVSPVTQEIGTFYRTEGAPQIPIEDKALLAGGHKKTVAEYSNPLGDLNAYLAGLTPAERKQQAELLLKRKISSVEPESYAGKLPDRAQVIRGAAKAHRLHPAMLAAFLLAEQRDQSQAEDAKDFQGATSVMRGNTSIGLGQVVVSTAQREDLFDDLLSAETRKLYELNKVAGAGGHVTTARLLASDEFNIFAAAKYIRLVADKGKTLAPGTLPRTVAAFPGINFGAYAGLSDTWPDDNIRALASEYTSTAWDDSVSTGWANFVWEAYQDVLAAAVF